MEKQKKLSAPRLTTIPFLLVWIGGHILIWSLLYGIFESDVTLRWNEIIWITVCGLIMGVGLSLMQKILIQYTYYAPLNWWMRVTIAGWVLGWIVFYNSIEFIENYIPSIDEHLSLMLLPLFVTPAVMQWFILRRNARQAWLWIVAGAASAMAFGALYGDLSGNNYFQFFLGAGAQGAVTGLSLLWLYGQSRAEKMKSGTVAG
jgi:hypothetical protein